MSATSAGTGPPMAISIFDALPQDIVFKICDELLPTSRPKSRSGKRALIALACTSSYGRLVAERTLYAQLELNLNNGRQKLVNLLDALLKRPDRAPHIKELAFHSSGEGQPWPSRSSTPDPIATLHTTPIRILLNNLAMLDLGYMRRLVQVYDIHGLFPLLIAQATQLRSLSVVGPCIRRPNPLATVLQAPYDIRLQLPTFDRLTKISHWDFESISPSGPTELIYAYLRQPHLEELQLRLSNPPYFVWSGPPPSCLTLTTLVLDDVSEDNLVKLLSATPKLRKLVWHRDVSWECTPYFRLDMLMGALTSVAATLEALTLRYGVFDDVDYQTDPTVVGSLDLSSFQHLVRLEVPWLILNDFNRWLYLSYVRIPRGVRTLFLDVIRYNGLWGIDPGDLEFSLGMILHERERLLPRLEELKCGFIEELGCP